MEMVELKDFPYKSGKAQLFRYEDNRFYVLYEGLGPGMKNECLILEANEDGRVTNWDPVASVSGMSRDWAFDELRRRRGPA